MTSPAFIVEGQMEQRIIAALCPGRPIRRLNCNGKSVTLERLCDFIETQVRTFGNRNYPIFVIFDREQRQEGAQYISDSVITILSNRGLNDLDIRVFVADRMTEDWYLLDKEGIADHFDVPVPVGKLNGKNGMSKILQSRITYHETTVGVKVFGIVSKNKLAEGCPQFNQLLACVRSIGCDI